jgi:DNA-binding beta-propeller fold protein YncE
MGRRVLQFVVPLTCAITASLWQGVVRAEIAVSSNDGKVALIEGRNTTLTNPRPDTVTIIDLSVSPPRVIGEVGVPSSVNGPPVGVAVAPDESIALVTSSLKIDPADSKRQVLDDRMTVVDLKASPPAVVATFHTGPGAGGVSFNHAGTLALVANRSDGTVSVFSVSGKTVTPISKVDLGNPQAGASHVVFLPDDKTALVTRNNDNKISILSINGTTVEYTKRDIIAGLRPYGIDITPKGDVAVVGSIAAGFTGGHDPISVIDLTLNPPRLVDSVTAGPIIEGIKLSPDGRYVAAQVLNGSNLPKTSPIFNDYGLLRIYRRDGTKLVPVVDEKVGHWCQGVAWSRDSKTILIQCAGEQEIAVYRFDGQALHRDGAIKTDGAPGSLRTAER